jgi:FkbM family methyltransferase
VLKRLLRRALPLRRRHQIRLLFGRYPAPLRDHYPDLAMMRLRPGAVVVDVGANKGQFAESVIAHQPYAQLHLFEPIPEAFETLRQNLADLGGIHFNNLALGNFNGHHDLVVRRFDEATSFLDLGKRLIDGVYGLDFASDRTIKAEVRKLADYVRDHDVPAIELLKLDVQGYELEVLRGAEEILPRVHWIYTEAQFQELYAGGPSFTDTFAFLNARGFDLVRMTSFRADDEGRLMECDMIFRSRGAAH